MKIGILTIHSARNYGAVLQAFALSSFLQNHLDSQKYEIEMIDFRPSFLNPPIKYHFSTNIRADFIELERLLLHSKHKHRGAAFDRFISENESLSPRCVSATELEKIAENYDILISGSDQIWNYQVTGHIKSFFLNFPSFNGKRIAYASSFGNYKFSEADMDEVASFLKQYTFLSCRETDGCAFIEDLIGAVCRNVCDPTLLNDADTYSEVCQKNVRPHVQQAAQEKYVLIYNLSTDPAIYATAQKVAKEKGYKVYQIFPTLRKNSAVDRLFQDASPEEFLYLFKNASFVITNSFHGTCFSLIFSKDFFTVNPSRINRLASLLGKIGLLSRIVKPTDELDLKSTLDYAGIQEGLKNFRKDSIDYLIQSIQK